jgi:uncharacterized membrane protein
MWSRAFGTGEFALRSPSAIAGTLLVPVSFLAAYTFIRLPRPALAVATASGNIGIRKFVADRPHHIVPEQFSMRD